MIDNQKALTNECESINFKSTSNEIIPQNAQNENYSKNNNKTVLTPEFIKELRDKEVDIAKEFPQELTQYNRFVCCNKAKQPKNAKTGGNAIITDTSHFASLEQCKIACKKYKDLVGYGYVLGQIKDKTLIGLDFDGVIDANGNIEPEVLKIIEKLDTYTELSPSGTGIHCLFYATKQGTACKNTHHYFCKAIEMYDKDRYFTITGKRLNNKNIEYRQAECDEIYEKYIKKQSNTVNNPQNNFIANNQNIYDTKSDEEYLKIGLEKDKKLRQYYEGVRFSADESSNDMGYCSKLLFWTNNNIQLVIDTFFNSPYYQTKDNEHKEKAQREDYIKRTLENITVGNARDKHFDFLANNKVYNLNKKIKNENAEVQRILEKLKKSSKPPHYDERTDLGTSTRFANTTCDVLRFNADRNCWMYYNDKMWKNDTGDCIVNQYAKYFKRALYLYAIDENNFLKIDESSREEYMDNYQDFVHSYGSKRKRDVMIKDAESVYPIYNKDLDTNPNLLNLQNGTLNLKTKKLQEHKASDLISKIANVSYNPNAKAERFIKFMQEIMLDNQNKIRFILRILGYSLTANTREEKFFIFYGATTRNGKSSLLETYLNLLGDYGVSISPETLAIKRFSDSRAANGDIARLDGVRFVTAPEPPENMILNISDIKTLTGGDTITARNPYERQFQFRPAFKLIINTNHLPKVNDETVFTSNRLLVVTFDKHFEEYEQDKSLKQKLSEPEELSGILNLVIEGLKDYQENGLNPPPEVLVATSEYRGDCDTVKNFIKECFKVCENHTMTFRLTYNAYKRWCMSSNTPIEAFHKFTKKLRQNVEVATKDGNRNTIIGYNLISEWLPEISSPDE